MNILDAIGNTSLVSLGRTAPSPGAEIMVKLEWENPRAVSRTGWRGP